MNGFDQQPAVPRTVPWKPIAIIVAVAVLVVSVAAGAWWFVQSRHAASIRQTTINQAAQELDQTLANCDTTKNPDGCKQQQVEAVAGVLGASQICEKLEGDLLVNCAWGVAVQKMNADDCQVIPDETKRTDCADAAYRLLAVSTLDTATCEKISSDIGKTRCLDAVTDALLTTQGCAGVDANTCAESQAYASAVASGDPTQCDTLANASDQTACHDTLGAGDLDHDGLAADREAALGTSDTSVDTDADGLTDADEFNIWGTDPTNPDTDGDGFLDGQEASGGYDPLGPGTL